MTSPSPELASRLELAVAIALEAGQITLQHYQSPTLAVESKPDDSPVTAADRAAETLLRRRIAEVFADDAIVGEEFAESDGSSGYRWVLDPIDGTKSFICGVPLYGTLVGVEHEGRGVVGVIHIPVLRETVYAAKGGGAWLVGPDGTPRPTRVSGRPLTGGVLLTTDQQAMARREADGAFAQLAAAARLTRTWGDCYGYLQVAAGRAELMIDPYLNVWDAAALQPVLEEAGGHFVDWRGKPTIHGGDGIGAASREALDAALAVTRNLPLPQ